MARGAISWRVSTRSSDGGGGSNCVEIGTWRVSSRSSGGGGGSNCVEVGSSATLGVAVRDTKHRDGGILSTDPDQWQTLLAAVKHGTFDR